MLAYEYGRHLGLAFQIVDDVLDFTVTPRSLSHTHAHTHIQFASHTHSSWGVLTCGWWWGRGDAASQASKGILGKPTLNDLKSGLSTAPTLYAAEEFPVLVPLIKRKFSHPGDVEQAAGWVFASKGIDRARELAATHAHLAAQAVGALRALPPYQLQKTPSDVECGGKHTA